MALQYSGTLKVSAANTTAVAALQTLVGAGNLTLASSTVTLPNGGQRPSLTCSGGLNLSGVTFTFTGTDRAGNAMTMSMAGPNNTTVVLPATMGTITNIASSGAVAATGVSAGYAAQADTNPLPLDTRSDPTNVSITLKNFTGSATPQATVRFTQDPVFTFDGTFNSGNLIWFNHATLVAQTAAGTGNFAFPVVAAGVFLDGEGSAATVDYVFLQSVQAP
jgi:hypothetical protein